VRVILIFCQPQFNVILCNQILLTMKHCNLILRETFLLFLRWESFGCKIHTVNCKFYYYKLYASERFLLLVSISKPLKGISSITVIDSTGSQQLYAQSVKWIFNAVFFYRFLIHSYIFKSTRETYSTFISVLGLPQSYIRFETTTDNKIRFWCTNAVNTQYI